MREKERKEERWRELGNCRSAVPRCVMGLRYTPQVSRGVRIKLRIIGKRECGFVSKRRVGRKGAQDVLSRPQFNRMDRNKGATEQNNADVQGTRN